MSGDHDACPNCGAGAMWCDCDPDRKVEREAYIRGAKDYAEEVRFRALRIAGSRNTVYSDFGAGYLELEYERVRGEWPKGE